MKTVKSPPSIYLEISPETLRILDGDDGMELSLERAEGGRLSAACRERVVSSVQVFLKKRKWSRPSGICAISARGVTLRRLSLPPCPREELPRLIRLQIEREFPLGPEELAWGYRKLDGGNGSQAQEVMVVAVRNELIQEYADLFSQCGLDVVFTPGALIRNTLCHGNARNYALLDLGNNQSELVTFEDGVPQSLRVLPWGSQQLDRAIESRLEVPSHQQDKPLRADAITDPGLKQKIEEIIHAELRSLTASIGPFSQKIFVTGGNGATGFLTGSASPCEPVPLLPGEGRSAAVLGMKKAIEDSLAPPIILEVPVASEKPEATRPALWKWAALAATLGFIALLLPYLAPLLQKQRLLKRIAEIEAYREKLPRVDRDLAFLQYLQTNQPAYLDALHALANAAQPGTRIESLSLTRRGDVSIRASMRDSQQLADLRSKLIGSGIFSTIVVEEQTPSPDRQKITARIVGQWKPISDGKTPAPVSNVKTEKPPQNPPASVEPARSVRPNLPAGVRIEGGSL